MLSSNGRRTGILIVPALVFVFISLLATGATPPWAFTAPLAFPLPATLDAPLNSESSWTGFSPSGWSRTQSVSATVSVSSPDGLDATTAAYRFVTDGDMGGVAWTTSGLGVASSISMTADLSVNGLAAVDSATQNKIQFRISSLTSDTLSSSAYTVRVDSTAPASGISSPAPGAVVSSTSTTVQGSASDATSGISQVDISINGGAWQAVSGTGTWTYSWSVPSADGAAYSVVSRASDQAGNVETPGAGVTVTVDNVRPSSGISSPSSGQVISGTSYPITGTASDGHGIGAVDVSIDGGAWQRATGTTSWSYNWTLPTSGIFTPTIRSRAIDLAGNVQATPDSVTVTVDNRVPSSSITSPSSGALLSGSTSTVRGTASSGVTLVEVSADGTSWASASGTTSWEYEWTLPSDGNYTLRSKARDGLGRIETPGSGVAVTVDNTAPSSSISSPTPGRVISGTAFTIGGSASDANGIQKVDIRIDGGAWVQAGGTGSWTYGWTLPTADGADYLLKSRATDQAGNTESPGSGTTVTVDNVRPSSSVNSPSAGQVLSGTSYLITGTASDGHGIGAVDVSIDGGAWQRATGTTSWSYNWTLPTSGIFTPTIRSRATDAAGNVQATPDSVTVTVDNRVPTSTITMPSNGALLSGSTSTVRGTASEGVTQVEVSADGTSWASASGTTSWEYEWTLPSDGNYTLRSKARDGLGRIETPGSGVAVTVDNTAPSSSIASPTPGRVISGTAFTIGGSAADANGIQKVDIRIDGGAWVQAGGTGSWTYSWTLPTADGGDYVLKSRATDQAGNTESPGSGTTVTVDNVRPSSSINSPSAGQVLSGTSYLITGTASDGHGIGAVDVSIDGGAWQRATGTTSWSYNWTLPTSGIFTPTIRSRAIDAAGNIQSTPDDVTVTVDNRVPSSTITSPSNGALFSGSAATVEGTASAGVTLVEVSADGTSWASASGTTSWEYEWTLPSDGTYHLRSRARDALGRVETPGPGVTVTVDNTPPSSNISSPSQGQVISGTAFTVAGSASDPSGIDKVQIRVGGGSWTTAVGTASWTHVWNLPSSDGASYVLSSRATDRAGNVESPGAGVTARVDNIPPVSTITTPANGAIITTTRYTVAGTASDGLAVASVQVSIDGGSWINAAGASNWSYEWNVVGEGMHSIRSRAIDSAGNIGLAGPASSVTVDLSGPQIVITSPVVAQIISGTTFLIAGVASDENGVGRVEVRVDDGPWNSAIGSTGWTYTWALPSDGTHYLAARAIDLAGNVGVVSSEVAVIVDNTQPDLAITFPTTGQILSGTSHEIRGTAADATSGVRDLFASSDGGTTWHAVTVGASWTHTWTSGSEDGLAHVLMVRGTDNAGNTAQSGGITTYVDNVAPLASMRPLPATINATDIQVEWYGSDGSGIASFDVQMKTDDGSWSDWILSTISSRAPFAGRGGHTYGFRVRARDSAGNVGNYAADGDTRVSIPMFKSFLPIAVKPSALANSRFAADRRVGNGGDELLYSVEVINTGRESVVASVRGPIPANTAYVGNSAAGGLAYDGSAVVWSGSVPALGTRVMSFRVRVSEAFSGRITTEATIAEAGSTLTLTSATDVVVANGRFGAGNLSGWSTGGTLGLSAAQRAGLSGIGLLLGNPSYDCGGPAWVPVDRAEAFQTVRIPTSGNAVLSFWFRMFSQDVEYSSKFGSHGDTLDVHVRDTSGNNIQLLLRSGAPYRTVNCGLAPWDSGWQYRTYDLSALRGQEVQIYFALWNRIDGWYNSYAYLDDVRID